MNDIDIEKNFNYLVSGDSISRGVIYDELKGKYTVCANCFVALVQKRLKGIVYNASRFGNTLTRGIGRLGKDLDKDHPDIVLIEYGGNDCDFAWAEVAAHPELAHEPQTDLALFEDTLTDTIATLKGRDIVPVLMTLPPLNADSYIRWEQAGPAYREQHHEMARKRHEDILVAGTIQLRNHRGRGKDENAVDRHPGGLPEAP